MAIDLNAVSTFIAVAEARSFRVAGERLGLTRSAVSQAVRRLEAVLDVSLLSRTTRSVSLTEAGRRFLGSVSPALADVCNAVADASDRPGRPAGLLRLAVSSIAEDFISGPLLTAFRDAHPDIQLYVLVTDQRVDVVAEGFDAGVWLGERVEQDMVAIPVSGQQRQVVVAAPSYIEKFGALAHPRELIEHRCIGWRPAPDQPPFRWEFAEGEREYDVEVNPAVTTNDVWLMLRLACSGAGLTFGVEEVFRPWIASGRLVTALDEYCPTFPGFFLYYPRAKSLAPKLRALIDHVKKHRRP